MHYLGIDVSKATLDVSDAHGNNRLSSANSRAGIRKLVKWASKGSHAISSELQFVIEPTSTYHHVLLDELSNSSIAFTVINPARTKAYSNSLGKRAKTDRVDAQLLASLGETQQIAPSHQPERFQEQIRSLRRHRESIEQQIRSLRNQTGSTTCSPWADPEVLRSLRSTIRHLEKQVVSADRRLEQLISEDETYSTISNLLRTIP
jgi:transposase